MRRGCTPCLPRCAWRACCAGYSAGCSWSLSQQTETKWDNSVIWMQNISGIIHLDSEISCQLPCVSVIFFLLKLNLMIMCLLWRMGTSLWNLLKGSLNSSLPHLDIVKLLHKTLFNKVNHPVLANSNHTRYFWKSFQNHQDPTSPLSTWGIYPLLWMVLLSGWAYSRVYFLP